MAPTVSPSWSGRSPSPAIARSSARTPRSTRRSARSDAGPGSPRSITARGSRAGAGYERPPGISWDEERYQGDAYGAFAWAAYVAEVEVDLRTCVTRVIDFVAVQEVGKVVNETLARGQIQGGVVQGIGWALMEECKFKDGSMINNQLTNYLIPTADDVPPISVAFLETPYPHG